MNIVKSNRLLSVLLFLALSTGVSAERIAFINDNLGDALNRASSQGKLIFLDFYADYCSPCKLMEEYTFTHPSVVERMNASYVPVKVNIQNFDGFDLKNQFKVTMLPTLIVLDSKGRMVGRYEESMSASRLVNILEKHDLPVNRKVFSTTATNNLVISANESNVSFATSAPYATKPAAPTTKPSTTTATSPARPSRAEYTYTTTNNVSNNKPVSYNTTPTVSTTSPSRHKPLAPEKMPASLHEKPMKRKGFTIQIGSFADPNNANLLGKNVQKKLSGSQKVFMLKSESNRGAVVYKVFVGEFTSRQQAFDFKMNYGFEGFVQDFTNFKQ